jgi:probable rRNA maturation factor
VISFGYEDVDWLLDGEDEVAAWATLVLRQHGFTPGAITVVFCSDDHLLYLNRTYLSHDYFTDILTFNYTEGQSTELVGDLFISIDTVRSNATEYGASFIDELHRVIIHGMLHLAGHDDQTEESKAQMRHQEDVALNLRMF